MLKHPIDAETLGISQALQIPPEYRMGPALKRLNDRSPRLAAFVIALIDTGGRNNTEAARLAGYSGTPDAMKTTGYRLAHDEDVRIALREEAQARMESGAILAVEVVRQIMDDPTAERKDRLKAAEMYFNRIGMHATTEHKMSVTHKSESDAEVIERIKKLSGELGIDPAKLLGKAVIEAEFEEVTPGADPNDISDLL